MRQIATARPELFALVIAALLAHDRSDVGAQTASAPPSAATTPPTYRIIYNWDGAPHGYSPHPQTLEQFLDKTFAPLKDTQVDALFWCVGEHEATWQPTELEFVADGVKGKYRSVRSMTHHENIRSLLARGENPYQAMVARGKQLGIDVFLSIRMNDNHFSGLQVDEMASTEMIGLTRLRKDHPEWCLGADKAPKWFALSWNMAVPEVREHRFKYIQEALAQAEWDGIELDWQRHAFHLPADDASRLSYTLTDLQRAVRKHTEELARKRGRPFFVAVRVATTLEACRRIGYDLPAWVGEDLLDILVAGGGAGTDPGVEVEGFRDLIAGTDIQFYPGFDSGAWGEHHGLEPHADWQRASFRGWAQAYWQRGADGIYVFNWHANEKTRRDLLTTVGSSSTLRGTDKVYATLHRTVIGPEGNWVGADLNDRLYGQTPVALYRTLTGDGPSFLVSVHDDVEREAGAGRLRRCELRIEVEHFSPRDRLAIALDGKLLRVPEVRMVRGSGPLEPSDVSDSSWLVWSLPPARLSLGRHVVQVRLAERDPRLKPPPIVRHVEVHLDYER